MTSGEIKEAYSMRDIAARYGLVPNRSGFIRCPFHSGDRDPSLKLYDRDFHCHACGAHGDIFDFIMMMEGISFKEAFQSLGGEYQKPTFSSRLAVYRAQKRQAMRQKAGERGREARRLNNMLISIYRAYMERAEPFSDVWCDCCNALQYQLYLHGELNSPEGRWQHGAVKQTDGRDDIVR